MTENIFFEDFKDTPDGSIPFSRITADMYEPAIERGIEKALAEIDAIAGNPAAPDMDNTILALERVGADLDRVLYAFDPLSSAMSTPAMMEIEERISPKLSEFSMAIALNAELWERVRTVYDNRHLLHLDREDMMLLENRYFSFERNGALLQGDDRRRMKQISRELSELTTKFANNVLSELNDRKVDIPVNLAEGISDELTGPAASAAAAAGLGPDTLRFGLDQPTYMAVMKSAVNRDVRRKFYMAYCSRNIGGPRDNMKILSRIAALRRERAALLGFPDAASLIVDRNMAHTPQAVMRLLNELREAYRKPLDRELAELTAIAGHQLQPWDYSYYADRLRKERYSFDEEALRPYLPLDRVVSSMLGVAGKLYGLRFVLREDIDRYHDDVRVYQVNDADGSYIGLLYMDFYTRDTKRPGAWMTEFRPQHIDASARDLRPHITIVTNFAPPAADRPALLRPREVETLFHEFGHALHGLLSRCKYSSTSGTSVRRDFVELPSQMNEGFATRPEFLDEAARHYATGQPVPADYVEAWRRSQTFGAAYQCMRQLGFGFLDMAWHTIATEAEAAQAAADPVAFERAATAPVRIFDEPEGTAISPQFSHIFAGGYAAGYYSYKWAEVLAADAFDALVDHTAGTIDHAAASSFRHNILERGGSDDPAVLYRNFRGHDAGIEALLRRDGIIS